MNTETLNFIESWWDKMEARPNNISERTRQVSIAVFQSIADDFKRQVWTADEAIAYVLDFYPENDELLLRIVMERNRVYHLWTEAEKIVMEFDY